MVHKAVSLARLRRYLLQRVFRNALASGLYHGQHFPVASQHDRHRVLDELLLEHVGIHHLEVVEQTERDGHRDVDDGQVVEMVYVEEDNGSVP